MSSLGGGMGRDRHAGTVYPYDTTRAKYGTGVYMSADLVATVSPSEAERLFSFCA